MKIKNKKLKQKREKIIKSKVEVKGIEARYYDTLLNIVTFGQYPSFIKKAIKSIGIKPTDKILDLGAGTGRNACLMMKYISTKGELVGFDISNIMMAQFKKKCADFSNAKVIKKRIDEDFKTSDYKEYFDKVFISFALHGFSQEVRKQIIKNAFKVLKKNGKFFILDYNEFSIKEMPFYFRIPFKLIECPYAFDFIKMDCKKLLSLEGFKYFKEHLFFNNYVRLLEGVK